MSSLYKVSWAFQSSGHMSLGITLKWLFFTGHFFADWKQSGDSAGPMWEHFGMALASFWDQFGIMSEKRAQWRP